jgi:hypothetical protein
MKSVILSHLVLTASLLAKTETPEAGRQDLIPGDRVTCGEDVPVIVGGWLATPVHKLRDS